MEMTKTFSNIGMGVSAGSMWADINGKQAWVSFLATAEGVGRYGVVTSKKRTWHVSASTYDKDPAASVRVTITKTNCHRIDAAKAALDELRAFLSGAERGTVQ